MNPLRKPFQYSFFRAAFALVIINTAVHFLFTFLSINKNFFGLSVIGFVYGHYFWQLVTYMFVHGDISHLFFNMLALLIFGTAIEKALGSKEFLLIIYIWGLLPVPAPLMVLGYGVIEFVSQFVSSSNVAHMTHLAGFAFAWLYFIARMGVHPIQVWKNAYRR